MDDNFELENWLKKQITPTDRPMRFGLEEQIKVGNTQAIMGPPPKNVYQFPVLRTQLQYHSEDWNTTVVSANGIVLGDYVEKKESEYYTTQYLGKKMKLTFYSKKHAVDFLLLGAEQEGIK